MPTFNWVFKYQSIASEILTKPSRYKRAESNLLPLGQVFVWVIQYNIHLYLYKKTDILLYKKKQKFQNFVTFDNHPLIPLASLAKTSLTSPPFCMEMILIWSSSFTHTMKVLASLWNIPRPSGQSRSMPAT